MTGQGRTRLNSLLNNFIVRNSFIDAYDRQARITSEFTKIFNNQLYKRGAKVTNFNSYFCDLVSEIELVKLNYSLFSFILQINPFYID